MDSEVNEGRENTHIVFRCRKCRKIVIRYPQNVIINAHGTDVERVDDFDVCSSLKNTIWYLLDDTVPDWVNALLEKDNWTRGKLSCPHCSARLGSFDFVSGTRCACSKHILPSVHIVKEKVDKSTQQLTSVD